jgi:hypothetical protein
MEDGRLIELLSIGIVCEDGREFYAEDADADWSHANKWVRDNVLPSMIGKDSPWWMTRDKIAAAIVDFVGPERPEFWAFYADYDWVALCQLYGTMMDLPKNWPLFCMDIKQLCVTKGDPRLPAQTSTEHNSLADANWDYEAWLFLMTMENP